MRPAPVQACPVSLNAERATTAAAASRSASASTMIGFLPPELELHAAAEPHRGVDLAPCGEWIR